MNYLSIAVMATLLAALPASAGDQTWTGKISDSMCGLAHKKMAEHGAAKMSDRDCTLACIKDGGKYVFVHDGKVHEIENQDFAALKEHAGHTVKLTGAMTGNSIKVSNVTMPLAIGKKKQP
jgi:hypothetical protein